MIGGDLSTFADQLRKGGLDARNLGQVGITVWQGHDGFFFSAEELRQLPRQPTAPEFQQMLESRKANDAR